MKKGVVFNPNENDLRKVMYYYGIEMEEQIVCPFHDDHRPSCHIDFETGKFHCFACEVHGDAFQFVKLANPKLDDLQNLRLYYAILNSDKVIKAKFEKRKGKAKSRKKRYNKEEELAIAHDMYYGLKTINWKKVNSPYKDYMLKRGFTENTLNKCKAKLTYTNKSFPIIFPLFDMNTFKGYVCRTTDKRVEKRGKYLYNAGFSRVDTLVGRYDNKVVMLVEGYMDMLKMKQHGVTYVAAILGWKITSKQIEKLRKQGVKTIISALDTDKPGKQGTDYLSNFFEVIPFQFPKGVKDPGELTSKQFKIANSKTKSLYRSRRKSNVHTKRN